MSEILQESIAHNSVYLYTALFGKCYGSHIPCGILDTAGLWPLLFWVCVVIVALFLFIGQTWANAIVHSVCVYWRSL